jgi:hypothetical protein
MVRRPLPESSADGFFQGGYYMGNCSAGLNHVVQLAIFLS